MLSKSPFTSCPAALYNLITKVEMIEIYNEFININLLPVTRRKQQKYLLEKKGIAAWCRMIFLADKLCFVGDLIGKKNLV